VQLAYLRFWVERARAVRLAEVDDAALAKVATGDAAERVRSSVRELAAEKHRAGGGATVNVRSLKLSPSKATLVDCFQDFSVRVDAKDRPLEAPDLGVTPFTVALVSVDGGWRVRELTVGSSTKVCS
jgi:hypothetical protein